MLIYHFVFQSQIFFTVHFYFSDCRKCGLNVILAPLHGFAFWFNVEFGWPAASPIIPQASVLPTAPSSNPSMDGSKRKKRTNQNEALVLSTAPEDPPTHWQNVLCILVLVINVHSLLLIDWLHK